jgi:hypothetical protein
VAALLQRRVQDPARHRRGIDADRRDPLPIAVVARDVAVEQPAHEPCLAEAPVDPEILRQERADDEARAVGHPADRAQLPHRSVDEWEPGAAGLPRLQRLVVVDPVERAHPRLVLDARVLRVVQEHVGEEVAPRELAHERLRPRRAAPQRPLLDLARGERAEVQVRREPRRAVAREVVVALGVRIEAGGQPPRERAAGGRLAGLGRRRTREPVAQATKALGAARRGGVRRTVSPDAAGLNRAAFARATGTVRGALRSQPARHLVQCRDFPPAHARRQRDRWRRTVHRAARQLGPRPMERREHGERRARARARLA